MKSKTKTHIIIITVFIVIALVTVAVGLFLTDALPARISYKLDHIFSRMPVSPASTDTADPAVIPVYESADKILPVDMHGVWLDLDKDLQTPADGSYGNLVAEANTYFELFRNVLAETVFIKPDLSGKYNAFSDSYGHQVDVLREIFAHAQNDQYQIFLIADDDMLLDESGAYKTEKVRYYLANYSFDGILIDSESSGASGELTPIVSSLTSELQTAFPELWIGVAVSSVTGTDPVSADSKNAISVPGVDFTVIEPHATTKSNPSFASVMKSWNAFAASFPQMRFYCRFRNDLVRSDSGAWSVTTEISDEIRALWDCERINGGIFVDATAIKKNLLSSVQRLSALLFDGDKSIAELKVNTLNVDAQKGTVRFSGVSQAGRQLRINGTVAKADGGAFTLEYQMSPGYNMYNFFSCGYDLKYRIYNNAGLNAVRAGYTDKVSPYTDNGLGTALMCRIVYDDTETLGVLNEKNTYHADYSTLPADTLDYVQNINVSSEGHVRYELKSGLAVYAENCELISNAFTMPNNNVIAQGVDDSSLSETVLRFSTDWLVPVTVKCNPQTYYRGYQSYAFNISEFTAEYVDITFAYTDQFFNLSNLQFAPNSVFSRSELYADANKNMILRLYLRQKGQFYGFHIEHENGQIIISCKKHADGQLAGKVVMLDPGHGGFYMTGTAFNNSIAEKDVSMSIALKAKLMLESYGATVLLTRPMDAPRTLEERCETLCAKNPDVFVSIHCDGTDSKEESGTHTFYFRPYSMPLANAIHSCMVNIYRSYIYKPTDINYPRVDKGIKYYPFFVTRMNNCPSVLCETGFMSNAIEGIVLTNDNYQYWMAQGIADGIRNYFASNY